MPAARCTTRLLSDKRPLISASLIKSGCRFLGRLAAISIALSLAAAFGQSAPNPFGIPQPTTSGMLGHVDAGVLPEITAHLKAVGVDPWSGMQGRGTITYGSEDSTSYDATYTNLGGGRYRLDAQTKKGEVSIRIHRLVGKIQDSDRKFSVMAPETASAGIFPFEILREKSFPGLATSLIDHGLTSIGGVQLHRITFERSSLGKSPVTHKRNTVAIDFYFDPTSHLLVKSATSVLIDGNPRAHFLVVVTYSDYREVDSSLIPFRYTETIDGQLSRTLQLSTVQLNPTLNSSFFAF